MKKLRIVTALLALLPAAVLAQSEPSKLGTEILVNTQKLYDQTLSQSAKLTNGGFVTVWVDWADSNAITVADGSWSAIKAQVFSANGVKVGAEILVNTATLNWQQDPRVVALPNGNFVVTWTDGWDYFSYADHPGSQGVGGATGDKEAKAIKAQMFTADGKPVGTEMLVNSETRSSQTAQKMTVLTNGNYVVTWEDWSLSCQYDANGNLNSCGGGPGIKAQLFTPMGAKLGQELALTGSYNYAPQIANLTGGGFVVIWYDGHYSVEDIRAQVYNAAGVKVGAEILVNTNGTGATFSTQNEGQVVGLNNGGFAVAWTDKNGDDSSYAVKTQVFDAAGMKVGSELLVNTTTLSYQYHPRLAALKNGGFVIAWENWAGDIDINAQVFSNTGAKVGTEILASASAAGAQTNHSITALAEGAFAVSWTAGEDIKLQAFDALGTKIGAEQQVNTTTAGGQDSAQVIGLDGGRLMVAWNDNLYGPSDGSGSAVKAQLFSMASTASAEDCLLNWAESNYARLFAPAAVTRFASPYTYRYYQATNAYLGVSAQDGHVYYLAPSGQMLDVGEKSFWYLLANCQ